MESIINKNASIIVPLLNEAEHIGGLLDSLSKQLYRPLQVVLVDGGSKDQTIEIVQKHGINSNRDIALTLLRENDYPGCPGTAHARNIGLMHSTGDYILLIDADFVLFDALFVSKVVTALEKHPSVSVRIEPIVDTFVERQVSIDDYTRKYHAIIHYYFSFRREIIGDLLFDQSLGFGEDYDFFYRIGVNPILIDAVIGRHYCHSLNEYAKQWIWYGKTLVPFLKKYFPKYDAIVTLGGGLLPLFLLAGAFLSGLLAQIEFSIVFILLYFAVVLLRFLLSPIKNLPRLAYLTFGTIFRSIFNLLGLLLYVTRNRDRKNHQRT